MGTLTADCPRLDAHCPHKLATSCRLTSTPNCCACADERVHSRTYRVYIDGVGFVNRGTRWQGYCWFCKEFWSNRLAATEPPLETSQTRVPEVPDQTEFLERWWEFHQGYRIAKLPDGTEQRIAVMGEPFREVGPGFFPRTLDQLRAGVENDANRPENRLRRRRVSSEEERLEQPHQSLEDALDNLLQQTEELEIFNAGPTVVAEPRASVTPRIQEEPSEPTRPMTRREAQQQTRRERFAHVFGSREELEQDDYESPLTQMYTRAFDRQRQADQRRAEGTEIAPRLDGLPRQDGGEIEEQLLWGVMQERQSLSESLEEDDDGFGRDSDVDLETTLAMPGGGDAASRHARVASTVEMLSNMRTLGIHEAGMRAYLGVGDGPLEALVSLDSQGDRPGPKTDAEMTKVLACQVCYQQIADVAVLPCGHMVMCQWCADVIVPVKHGHIPTRPTRCPMCRKQVKQRFKIHTG